MKIRSFHFKFYIPHTIISCGKRTDKLEMMNGTPVSNVIRCS